MGIKNRFAGVAGVCFLFLLLCGCTVKSQTYMPQETEPQEQEYNTQVPSSENASKGERDISPLELFKTYMPDAQMIDTISCDLDANGEDDYIILFTLDNGTRKYTTGLSVCLSNVNASAITLSDDQFIFCSNASLEFVEGIPVISVKLKDTQEGTTYLYKVEYSYDASSKQVNYKIASEIAEQEGIYES